MFILTKFIVKILLSFAVVVMLSATVKAQTPVLDLPELQEWYSWPGATNAYISYLPNFKKGGGENAIAQGRAGSPTWFNRFAFDTVNQFTWKDKGSNYIVSGDFNGDGITDYWTAFDRVHRGIANGEFPNVEPDTNYFLDQDNGICFVWDVNNDGYDDILQQWYPTTCSNCPLFRIIFGGKDLKHLRQTIVRAPPFAFSKYMLINAYKNENGLCRIISYRKDDYSEGFYLYGLTFEGTPNDSIIVTIKELSAIEEKKANKNQLIFLPVGTVLLRQTSTLGFSLLTVNNRDGFAGIYSIINDKFEYVRKLTTIGSSFPSPLYGSINKDSIEEFITPVLYKNVLYYGIYSGNLINDTTVKALIPLEKKKYGYMTFSLIGDVNNDGIQDIAGCSQEELVFVVYLGIDWQKLSSISEIDKPYFSLRQTEPNPVGKDGTFVLPMSIEHNNYYTLALYDLTGKRLGELFSGELPSGEIRLPFDVQVLNIPAGMYTLRLSDGKHSRERAFVISR